LKHDYILRLIEQLARVFAALLQRLQEGRHDECRRELEDTLHQLTGLSLGLVGSLSLRDLLAMLQSLDGPDLARCLALAELLYLDALDREARGDEEGALAARVRALTLYLEVLLGFQHEALREAEGRAEKLIEGLREHDLPLETLSRLFRHFEATGRFARAEDVLFEMLELGQDQDELVAAGIVFYQRLLELGDSALETGGLPRDEVEESLAQLRARSRG
jgi:hypothetical protein